MNADFAHDACRESDHIPCAICGHPVCLGFLSDYQQERVLWRAKAERRPITHHDCRAQEMRAA